MIIPSMPRANIITAAPTLHAPNDKPDNNATEARARSAHIILSAVIKQHQYTFATAAPFTAPD